MLAAAALAATSGRAQPPCEEGLRVRRTRVHPLIVLHLHSCEKPLYRAQALEVPLDTPLVSLVVTPHGSGRLTTSQFAQTSGSFAAVNGGYRSDEGGYTVSSGKLWGEPGDTDFGTVLGIGGWDSQAGVTRVDIRPPEEVLEDVPAWMLHAVSGRPLILENGQPVPTDDSRYIDRHPRTAAGLSEDRRTLWLLTVDGRQRGWSLGMSGRQLAETFISLGATRAVNLDGGGSTTMVVPSLGGLVNKPCARKGREERPVLNHIGVIVDAMSWTWPQLPAFAPPSTWFVGGSLGDVAPHVDS